METGNSISIYPGDESVWFAFKTKGKTKIESFAVKPGYLYSIFVFWKSSESPAQGWTEFSFTTDKANVQSGSN